MSYCIQLDNGLKAYLIAWALCAINAPSFSKHYNAVSLLQTYQNDIAAPHAHL
jgi:hypothetical protein